MPKSLTVLVTGATGHQGGALSRLLLNKGHRVRAFTRNSETPSVRALEELGAEVSVGSFDEPESMERAMDGVDAVFGMSAPYEDGTEAETRRGIAIANAAQSSGVRHLVFTSAGTNLKYTGVPNIDSRLNIEKHIASLSIPSTIVGLVFFMDNLLGPFFLPRLREGKLKLPLPPERTLAQTSLDDIASFLALVIENSERFTNARINIGSDELSGKKMAEILSHVLDRPVEFSMDPVEQPTSKNRSAMFRWLDRVGFHANLSELHHNYPEVGWRSFEEWAQAQNWSVLQDP